MFGHQPTTHNSMVKRNFKRSQFKVNEEGTTTDEILKAFLLSYRRKPNGSVKNGMCPVKTLMDENSGPNWMSHAHKKQKKKKQDAS